MSTSDHHDRPDRHDRHERTGAAIPASEGHRASPGPNPDDINQDVEHVRGAGEDETPDAPEVSPTTPGPNPDDLPGR